MKKRFSFSVLLTAGILLLCAGLIGLLTVPSLTQYAFLPGQNRDLSLSQMLEKARDSMGESFPLLTLHGQKSGVTLTANDTSVNDVCLYLTGSRYPELYPRNYPAGRPVSGIDAEKKDRVIALDRETAFTLFGPADPLGRTVKLGETELEVIGVAEHSRSLGETGQYAAWVPLDVITDCDLLVLSAPDTTDSSLRTAFRTGASEIFGAGTLISLSREKTAATILLRFTALVLAVWMLKRWLKVLLRFGSAGLQRIRSRGERVYFSRLFPYALAQMLPVALLVLLTVAAGYGLALLAVEPIRVFPEWVPESLGDFSSWAARFWSLVQDAARPVSLQTPELAAIRFFALLLRLGLVFSLLGGLRLRRKTQPS